MQRTTRLKLEKYLKLIDGFENPGTLDTGIFSEARRFNEYVGLPLHPKTGEPTQLFDYQYDILNATERRLIVVKSRKIGISEVAIRRFAQRCFTHYGGHQVLFVSQSEEFAIRLMRRFQTLLESSPLKREVMESSQCYTKLRNGCEIFSRPTSAKALRSFDRVQAILMDECAHYERRDDYELYAAVKPSIVNTQGDIMLVSTPQGRRGFFPAIYFGDDSFRRFCLP